MKIIDLLNKIANGEDVPKKIMFENFTYYWRDIQKDYFCEKLNFTLEHVIGDTLFCNLNLKVEIIEEDKKIGKITIREKTIGFPNGEWTARNMDKAFAIKINEIIDEINKMKEGK